MVHTLSAVAMTAILLLCCSLSCQSPAGSATDILVQEVLFQPEICDKKAKDFDRLTFHYTGTLTETGVQFDSTHDRNKPFNAVLGVGKMIEGLEEGLHGMCVGEKRKLIIPPHLALGDEGSDPLIPPEATLTIEVELLHIKDFFLEIDADTNRMLSKEEILAFMKKQSTNEGNDLSGQTDEEHLKMMEAVFHYQDTDKDGFISHSEFSRTLHEEL